MYIMCINKENNKKNENFRIKETSKTKMNGMQNTNERKTDDKMENRKHIGPGRGNIKVLLKI